MHLQEVSSAQVATSPQDSPDFLKSDVQETKCGVDT